MTVPPAIIATGCRGRRRAVDKSRRSRPIRKPVTDRGEEFVAVQ
jgi:hypothetical protein